MTYHTSTVGAGNDLEKRTEPNINDVLAHVLLPEVIDRHIIKYYIYRAFRNRAWHKLSKHQKALLKVASKVVNTVRSPTLARVLRKIILEVELHTLKGRAIYYGLLTALSTGELLSELLKRPTYVMMLGINYLNNPHYTGCTVK